jgi:hypothetical protein
MKKKISKAMAVIQILTALVALGSKFIWAPVCQNMLTLENGRTVYMKCHWTGQLVVALGILLLVTSIMSLLAKDYSRFQVGVIIIGILLFLAPTSAIIGVCANEEMICHNTATWIKACGAVVIITGIIGLREGMTRTSQVKDW